MSALKQTVRGIGLGVCWAGLLICGAGCEALSFGGVQTQVTVAALRSPEEVDPDHADYGFLTEEYSVTVKSSGSESCEAGVLEMRNDDFEHAVEKLEAAVAENEKDHQAHFALGLSYECLRQFDKALAEYKAANRNMKRFNEDYDASRRRAEAKMRYWRKNGGARSGGVSDVEAGEGGSGGARGRDDDREGG